MWPACSVVIIVLISIGQKQDYSCIILNSLGYTPKTRFCYGQLGTRYCKLTLSSLHSLLLLHRDCKSLLRCMVYALSDAAAVFDYICPQYTAGALVQNLIVDEVAKRFFAALTAIGAENMRKGIVVSC